MLFINFKTYSLGTGEAAVRLAKTCQEVASNTGVTITPIVQVVDLYRLRLEVGENLWVQHIDALGYGPHTGWTIPAAVKDAGAKGTLLNHSEHQLVRAELEKAVTLAKQIGLKVMICAASIPEIKHAVSLQPDFIAYEPTELIGGHISVATSKPQVIAAAADILNSNIPLIAGAGIHSPKDIAKSIELGAKGVLVSSDILTAPDPKEELENLSQGFKL